MSDFKMLFGNSSLNKREEMNSESEKSIKLILIYRDTVKKVINFSIFLIVLLWLVLVAFYALTSGDESYWSVLVKVALSSSVLVTAFYRLVFYFHPRIYTRYELYKDHLIVIFKNKRYELKFSAIKNIWISTLSPRFFGGFGIEMKNGKKFYFLSMLKNNEQILHEIQKNKGSLLEIKKIKKYEKTSQTVDVSWERIKEGLVDGRLLIFKLIVIPMLLSLSLLLRWQPLSNWNLVSSEFALKIFLPILFCWILLAILNIYKEKIVIEHLIKSREKRFIHRDIEHEKKWERRFYFLYALTILAVILLNFI